MRSSIFDAIQREKSGSLPTGGKAAKSPTKVVRLPEDILSDFDHLRRTQRELIEGFPSSPRNRRLTAFLDALDEMFPMG